ncbi:hypothetical protein ACPB8P_31575 [Streptomyces cellulosae]
MDLDPKVPSMKLWQWLLTHGANEDEATELMNGYAHELAERQRAWAHEPMTDAGAPEYGSVENVLDAADRIDPYVEGVGFASAGESGTYVLSTRRPGAVSGPS